MRKTCLLSDWRDSCLHTVLICLSLKRYSYDTLKVSRNIASKGSGNIVKARIQEYWLQNASYLARNSHYNPEQTKTLETSTIFIIKCWPLIVRHE